MTDTNQKELGNTLWSIADPLRGPMDADDFRDDMRSFLFLRHLSDNDEPAAGFWLRPSRQGLLDDSKRRRGRCAEESTATACAGARPALRSPLRGSPNPRVRRWQARDPQAGELRQAACQHAVVADGMIPVLSTQAAEFFVSSCLRVSHSQHPDSRDRPATRCFIDHTKTRRHEEILLGPPREARTGHSKTVYASLMAAPCGLDAPHALWALRNRHENEDISGGFQTPDHNINRPTIGPMNGDHFNVCRFASERWFHS